MRQTIDIEATVATGDYTAIKNWLTENVHQFGKAKEPLAIMVDATGEKLNPKYLIDFLTKRYKDVYKLK